MFAERYLRMADNSLQHQETVLASVAPSRRNFLRGVIVAGTGASAALSLPCSVLLADEDEDVNGKGKGKAVARARGKERARETRLRPTN